MDLGMRFLNGSWIHVGIMGGEGLEDRTLLAACDGWHGVGEVGGWSEGGEIEVSTICQKIYIHEHLSGQSIVQLVNHTWRAEVLNHGTSSTTLPRFSHIWNPISSSSSSSS